MLTVQPFGVIFESPLEGKLLTPRRQIVKVGPEYNCVGFREFGVSSRVESGQIPWITFFYPDCSGVVGWVVGTFGNTHTDSRHERVSTEMSQIRLKRK